VDLNALPLPALFAQLVGEKALHALLELAREEDLGGAGDVTSDAMIDEAAEARANVVMRREGVLAGLAMVPHLLRVFGVQERMTWRPLHEDGQTCGAGTVAGAFAGSLRAILAIERTLLNSLSRLSGIATLTSRFVAAASGTAAMICDTRKTTPGWRALEKYAVRCGGGTLHRIGLYDAMLIKDNHLAHVPISRLAETVRAAAEKARRRTNLAFVEVEVDSLEQLDELLRLPAGVIDMALLDNMEVAMLQEAVRRRDASAPQLMLEASGGVTIGAVACIARTGVDRISVGALTHGATGLDMGLDIA
jgi:nicotinate-nucleotide pyrophosphorylase (carboxylating)